MRVDKLFAAAALLLFPAIASADPCAGASPFIDVPAGANYCTSAEWLKNRSITLGCTSATEFCPSDGVTRAQMALFMNRLGVALSPEVLTSNNSLGAVDLDAASPGNVYCQTPDYVVTGYPRRAFVMMTFAGLPAGGLDFRHEIMYSTNGGAAWSFYHAPVNQGGASVQRWTTSSVQGVRDFAVGQTVRWGALVQRSSFVALPSTADFDDAACFVTVSIHNRNSGTSPFDEPLAITKQE